eukprot:jgi/Hompol1/4777/HPOL_003875-RA
MTLRSLVSSKEAGVIIGKGGSNVAYIREITGVKVGVSKVVAGVAERILTVVGPLPNTAKAYAMIAKNLVETVQPTDLVAGSQAESTAVRLLIGHQLIGSIIGKAGSKIREIQEASGAKIVISKEMLARSTERVVEVYGVVDAIHIAVHHIGQCIQGDAERAAGIIHYDPQNSTGYSSSTFGSSSIHGVQHQQHLQQPPLHTHSAQMSLRPISSRGNASPSGGSGRGPKDATGLSTLQPSGRRTQSNSASSTHSRNGAGPSTAPGAAASVAMVAAAAAASIGVEAGDGSDNQTRTLSVPADMVGCIIGKGGSFINQIRRLSGAKLHIAEQLEGRLDREVTITGTEQANQKALSLLYNQLEAEKRRRLEASVAPQDVQDDGRIQR